MILFQMMTFMRSYVAFFFIQRYLYFTVSTSIISSSFVKQISVILSNESTEFHTVLEKIKNDLKSTTTRGFQIQRYISLIPTNNFKPLCQTVEEDVWPYFGSFDSDLSNIISSFMYEFNRPFLTWTPSFERFTKRGDGQFSDETVASKPKPKPCHVFSLFPDLTDPISDLLIQWGWKKFAYIYTSDATFARMQAVLAKLFNHYGHYTIEYKVMRLNLKDQQGTIENLKYLDQMLSRYHARLLVVDISGKKDFMRLLNCLKLVGMLRKEYHYLLADYGILDLPLSAYKQSNVNISGFLMMDREQEKSDVFHREWGSYTQTTDILSYQIGFILDIIDIISSVILRIKDTECLIDMSSSCYNHSSSNKQVTFRNAQQLDRCNIGQTLIDMIKKTHHVGYSGPIAFDSETCERTNYTISLSKFSGERPSRIVASWTRDSGWHIIPDKTNVVHQNSVDTDGEDDEHDQLANNTIRVVTIASKPFMMKKSGIKHETTKMEDYEGYCLDLARHIFELVDLKYEVHLVKDGKYGAYVKENKTWNGIVGELIRGEADVAIAPLTVSSSREKVIDFSEPFMTFGLSIIIKKPGITKPGTFSFLNPLSNKVWICIVTACLSASVALWIIARCSPYEWKESADQPTQIANFNFGNSLWFNFAAFVRQGVDFSPVSPGARILSSMWWLFSLLIVAYYTANLVAFLSVELVIAPISEAKDLVEKSEQTGIQTGTLDAGSTKEYFATSHFYPFKEIFVMMQEDKKVYAATIQEGIDRVRKSNGKYAFVLESKMNAFINFKQPCDTMMVGSPFSSSAYAVALPENRPHLGNLKERITDAILQLRESQKLEGLYRTWWVDKSECVENNEGSSTKPLALVNLSGAFYILIIGIILAMVVAFIQLLWDIYFIKKKFVKKRNFRNRAKS